jgi:hypothetical protein
VAEHMEETHAPIVVKEQQGPYEEQEQAGKERTTSWAGIRHKKLLSLSGHGILRRILCGT